MAMKVKLGKLAPRRSLRTPALGNFLRAPLVPAPPAKAYWEYKVGSWGMMRNDELGDCTCAAAGHMIMNWVAHGIPAADPTDEQVMQAYSDITGYDPATGANDNGAVELDVLSYWSKTGIAGHKISGYATLDVQNIQQIKAAIYLFGGVYLGFQVPQSIMDNTEAKTWDKIGGPLEGGHAVPALGYGGGGCAVISWGQIYYMSWEFWQHYVDEAYAVVSADWLKASGVTPTGLDLPGLKAALEQL